MTIYKLPLCSCIICKTQITINNISKHYNSHSCKNKSNEKTTIKKKSGEYTCVFCGIINTTGSHISACKLNPNRKPGKNQYTKAKERGEVCITSEESKIKRYNTRLLNGTLKHSEESKNKLSISMKKAVKEHPESYRGRYNRGFVKQIACSNGFMVLGSWEQKFVEFCILSKIIIEQVNTGFSYEYDGERTYFPDFYLPSYDLYVEVKGYEQEKDQYKWNSLITTHNKKLLIINSTNINSLSFIFENIMQHILICPVGDDPTSLGL